MCCVKQKWPTCYDKDSLSPDNSNPMQIKLSDFSLNLYLVGAISLLLLLFHLKPPFVVSSWHVKRTQVKSTDNSFWMHFQCKLDKKVKKCRMLKLYCDICGSVVSHKSPKQNVITYLDCTQANVQPPKTSPKNLYDATIKARKTSPLNPLTRPHKYS